MGVLTNIIEQFNTVYNGLAHIEFSDIKEYERVDHKRKDDKEFAQIVRLKLENYCVKIVDKISNDYSIEFCQRIAEILHNEFKIRPSIGSRMSKNGLNVVLIHNAAYYVDIDDPHDDVHPGCVVQHITFEDFASHLR